MHHRIHRKCFNHLIRRKTNMKTTQNSNRSFPWDLKSYFPCKRLRRSQRLEIKEKVDHKTRSIQNGPLGYFEILPVELKFHILTYLQIEDLSLLTIVSKSVRNLVEVYRTNGPAKKYLLPKPITHSVVPISDQEWYIRQFQRLGLLLKRSTCLYGTKDRLRIIQQFLQKFLCSDAKICEDPNRCIALVCYGKFLHTVIAGWDDKECMKTLQIISANTMMSRHLDSLLKTKPGSNSHLEMHVRLFYRRIFINQCSNCHDTAFWLSLVLKQFPMVHQARLIFLLFGPMSGNEIQWYEMCESTPVSKKQATLCFGELANCFRILHHYRQEWNEDDIISVLDELTSVPDEWLSENVAHLLFLCGETICSKLVNSKAINGRISELSILITSLCLACVRHEQHISWVMNIVDGICLVMDNPHSRLTFLNSVVDMFREVILDLHEFTEPDEDREQDMHFMLEAQAEFTKDLILRAFKSILG